MLITNYFQAKEVSPLQTQVVETLKQLNDQNADNPELQEQIRQLDLMARKAYFVSKDHLMRGVYLLIGMLVVFLVSVRIYFTGYKDIPDKEIDLIDEWAIKSEARKYVSILASGIATVAIAFVVFSMPFMQTSQNNNTEETGQQVAQNTNQETATETVAPETNNEPEQVSEVTGEKEEATAEDKTPAQPEMKADVEKTESEDTQPTIKEDAEEKVETEVKKDEKTAEIISTPKITSNGFRGNHSNGHSEATNIPVKWDLETGTNIAWKTAIPLPGQSSPVISGNKVFITGANEQSRQLLCYDLNTGKQLWSLAAANIAGSPSSVPETTPDTGLASSTVATNGNDVCAIFATGDIICANMQGKLLWSKNLGVPDNHYGYASSLLAYKNQVFIQYDNRNIHKIIALDTKTGNEVWSKDRTDKIAWSSPSMATVNNVPQLILMSDPSITAYNPETGEQIWRVECLTGEVGASACSYNNVVFGASEYAKMVAIDATNGAVLWESLDYLPEASSPVATASNVYLATSYGVVASFDTKTGALKKEHETNAEFYSSPMIVEGKIYLFANDGKAHVFSADDEFKLLDSFETGEKTFATPAFTDGRMVVRTEKSIYCVKENSNE